MNIVFQLAWLAHFPFWSFTMIIIDVLISYGLIARIETTRSAERAAGGSGRLKTGKGLASLRPSDRAVTLAGVILT